MDRLKRSRFLGELTGQVFLSQVDAMRGLPPNAPARPLGLIGPGQQRDEPFNACLERQLVSSPEPGPQCRPAHAIA